MNRRTLIRRLGATGLATTALASPASARPTLRFGVDRAIDVSEVSGTVTLDELLEPGEYGDLPARVDPRTHEITVADDAGVIALDDCCVYCCEYDNVCEDHCDCCTCDWDCV